MCQIFNGEMEVSGGMFDTDKKKSTVFGIITFLILTFILFYFIHHLDQNLLQTLSNTEPTCLMELFVIGCLCNLIDSCIYRTALCDKISSFTIAKATDLTYLRIFGKTALFAGGAFPLQSFYLFKNGLMAGCTAGIFLSLYTIQRASILIYASCLLAFRWKWIRSAFPALSGYLLLSYLICFCVMLILVLLCTSKQICRFCCRLIDRLPSGGKWPQRKQKYKENIDALYRETRILFRTKAKFAKVFFLNFAKLAILCSIPYFSAEMLGLHPYTLFQAQVLTSLMLLIAGVIPNIAGIGPVELSFFLVFSEILGESTLIAMVYYRCATYYFPFLLSIPMVGLVQKKLARLSASNPEDHGKH